LERDYDDVKKTKKQKQLSESERETVKQFELGVQKACKRFPELMTTVDGKPVLNKDSKLLKKVYELLNEDAVTAKNVRLGKPINPLYDHANGFYEAVRDARDILRDSSEKAESEQKKNDLNKKNEDDQLLTSSVVESLGQEAGTTDASKIKKEAERLKKAALDKGSFDSPEGKAYYSFIRKNETVLKGK
jgi:hypothetical protein